MSRSVETQSQGKTIDRANHIDSDKFNPLVLEEIQTAANT
jgi:hypothetical protein